MQYWGMTLRKKHSACAIYKVGAVCSLNRQQSAPSTVCTVCSQHHLQSALSAVCTVCTVVISGLDISAVHVLYMWTRLLIGLYYADLGM